MGGGSLSKELIRLGYDVPLSTDLYDRNYGISGIDFLHQTEVFEGNIITNPPFKQLTEFILKGLELTSNKLYIFARIQTLESIGRWDNIFKHYKPFLVCPFVKRIPCYPLGKTKKYGSAISYAWFIWDINNLNVDPIVKWLV